MNPTYLLLDLAFLAVVAVVATVAWRTLPPERRRPVGRAVAIALAVVLVLTAVFDNLLILAGIVAYDPERILGVFIGVAPVEDFAYTVAAVVGLPAVWRLLGHRRAGREHSGADAASAPLAEPEPR